MMIAIAALVWGVGAAQARTGAAEVRYEPTSFEVAGVGRVEAELGRFRVPEDRRQPDGRQIELVFGRLKSTAAVPGPPIVYLDGGPGGSGVGVARIPSYYRLFDALRAVGDVILLSQRGTGLSSPRLGCPPVELPPAFFSSVDTMTAALVGPTDRCVAAWRDKADLSAYTTEASADDVEDLRRALGAPRLHLLGFSYGTHLALAVMRRHPDAVSRVVLAGVEGPDHTLKLPSTYDAQLARLAARAPAASPDLVGLTRQVLARLEATPVTVSIPAAGDRPARSLTIGADGLRYLLRRDIGDTNDTEALVRMIRDAHAGDYELIGRFAARRFDELSRGGNLMGMAMDCASGASPERLARVRREEPDSLLGAMTNWPFPDVCARIGVTALPMSYRTPIVSNAPTLLISGTLDSNTPPYQAEEVRWGFPNATHLVVDGAGHESTLPRPEVQRAIVGHFATVP